MRSSLLLLAGLASYTLGLPSAPVKDRSLGLDVDLDVESNKNHGLDVDLETEVDIGNIHAELDLSVVIGGFLKGGAGGSMSLLGGLHPHAAAALQAGALGCSVGKIHHSALAELKAWLHGAVHLESGLKKALLAWCDAGAQTTLDADVIAGLAVILPTCTDIVSKAGLFVTIDGIFEAAKLEGAAILSHAAQSDLSDWLSGAGHLGSDIKAALSLCVGGGAVGSLTVEVQNALKAFLHSSQCTMHHGLKMTVLAWLEGKIEGGVVALGHLSEGALSSVSVGASILALVEESGVLAHSARQSLIAFLRSDVAAGLKEDIKAILVSCAKGEHAKSLSVEVRTALALWLSSSSCSLGAELKAVLLFWLSFALEVQPHVGLGLGGLVSDLLSFLGGTLGAVLGELRGVLSILLGGESFLSLSLQARAEIIAILAGATSIELPSNCLAIVIRWVTGCIIPGSGSPSTTSMIAPSSSSTPAVSIPVISTTHSSTPSVTAPADNTPAPSSSAPASSSSTPGGMEPVPTSSAVPSSSVPVGPGPDTSSTEGVPVPTSSAGPTSSSVPQVPAPSSSAPAGSSSTPGGMEPVPTSSAVPSSSVPVGPGPDTSSTEGVPVPTSSAAPSSSVPVGPGPDTSSTEDVMPVPTSSAAPTSSSVPEAPAPNSSSAPGDVSPVPTSSSVPGAPAPESTPCETETMQIPQSSVVTHAPEVTSAPAPVPTKEPKQTVTVTTTVSIASCL